MAQRPREFQIFAKPAGAICNLDCHYCYYLEQEQLYPETRQFRMADDLLCVVHAQNAQHPFEVYHFFREIGVR